MIGQQTLETPATERFIDLERQSRDAGMSRNFGRIEDADFEIFVPSRSRYEAMVKT